MVGKGEVWVIYNPDVKGFLASVPFVKWCSSISEAHAFPKEAAESTVAILKDTHPTCGMLKAKISL